MYQTLENDNCRVTEELYLYVNSLSLPSKKSNFFHFLKSGHSLCILKFSYIFQNKIPCGLASI